MLTALLCILIATHALLLVVMLNLKKEIRWIRRNVTIVNDNILKIHEIR